MIEITLSIDCFYCINSPGIELVDDESIVEWLSYKHMIWDGKLSQLSHWTCVLELVAQECINTSI